MRPWTANAVDWAFEPAPGLSGKPRRALLAGEPRRRAAGRRAAPLPGRGERLDRRRGVVDAARAALAGEVEAAVVVLLAGQPPRARGADGPAGRAQGEHAEARGVDEAIPRAVGAAQPGEAAGERTGRPPERAQREDRALQVARLADPAPLGREVPHRRPRRAAPGRAERHRRPARVRRVRAAGTRRRGEAARPHLRAQEVRGRAVARVGPGDRRGGEGDHPGDRGQREPGRDRRGHRAPLDLEPVAEACERADERRPEREAERDVAPPPARG
jgi:hypothetical protein